MSFIARSTSFYKVHRGSRAPVPVSQKPLPLNEHHFFFDADSCSLLSQDQTNPELSLARLAEMGGVQGLAKSLRTDLQTGLYKDEVEEKLFEKREAEFGTNTYPKKPPRGFLYLCLDELKDPMLIVLMIAGCVSIIAGTIASPKNGQVEGLAILIAVAIVTLISAGNNFRKEKQFRSLDVEKNLKEVIVIRCGVEQVIKNTEVQVGDIIVLQTGNSVPCDGIWITGTENLASEESALTGESRSMKKNFNFPFFLSGTQIVDGEGIMLATSIGVRTTQGSLLSRLDEERPQTPLQEKLEKMAKFIGQGGGIVALILFGILLIQQIVGIQRENKSYADAENLKKLLSYFTISVTIVVVAVPEGLPLAVTISLAYSMKKMYADKNFVRVLSACETMGNATTICSDKTGTLTQNLMSVCNIWPLNLFEIQPDKRYPALKKSQLEQLNVKKKKLGSAYSSTNPAASFYSHKINIDNSEFNVNEEEFSRNKSSSGSEQLLKNEKENEELNETETNFSNIKDLGTSVNISQLYYDILQDGIVLNSKAFAKNEKDLNKIDKKLELTGGNETECALLAQAIELGTDYKLTRQKYPIEKAYPFSSKVKRSSVLIKYKGKWRMYMKGAAETILRDLCSYVLNPDGTLSELTSELRSEINKTLNNMVENGLRCICLAYRDYDHIESQPTVAGADIIQDPIFEDYICVAITGIKDPVRREVPDSVRRCQESGIIVRMCTGDHPKTAEFIAAECGIRPRGRSDLLIMTGEEFRSMPPDQLEKTMPKLRVLARSTPDDKEKLVNQYMSHNQIVAVTGDGANDALALREAHVGLAMGIQGTDVAKEASDIIILDDSFKSIVETVKQGRCVYDNIRKFVQFQLTVNVVALSISLIGALGNFEEPLTAVQLLQVNLIMDTLAALAFGTEMPTDELLKRKPYSRDCGLISQLMQRSIFGQSAIQLTLLLLNIFPHQKPIGVSIFQIENQGGENSNSEKILRTCIFNTFVQLQIFNGLNSRKINGEINIFKDILKNRTFIFIFVFIIGLQIMMVELFGFFVSTTHLKQYQWFICIALGFLSVPTCFLLHLIPVNKSYGFIKSEGDRDLVIYNSDNTQSSGGGNNDSSSRRNNKLRQQHDNFDKSISKIRKQNSSYKSSRSKGSRLHSTSDINNSNNCHLIKKINDFNQPINNCSNNSLDECFIMHNKKIHSSPNLNTQKLNKFYLDFLYFYSRKTIFFIEKFLRFSFFQNSRSNKTLENPLVCQSSLINFSSKFETHKHNNSCSKVSASHFDNNFSLDISSQI